ncbi:hypothetical protein A7C91_09690 [Thermococcus piezophilus]|uniref:Uncharacterized protein n=1 Tax=Thermococcus piezophilus TaxID=1712654 RepID=A0A172WIU9_9EURY|nr:hypothetical protein A7C91_09690 [Thermococcus piezophilus]
MIVPAFLAGMFFTLVYLTTLYFLITSESLKRAVLMVPLLIGAYLLGKWAMFKAVESNGEILVWLAGAVILAVGIIPWLHRKASEKTPLRRERCERRRNSACHTICSAGHLHRTRLPQLISYSLQ